MITVENLKWHYEKTEDVEFWECNDLPIFRLFVVKDPKKWNGMYYSGVVACGYYEYRPAYRKNRSEGWCYSTLEEAKNASFNSLIEACTKVMRAIN